MKHTLIFSGAMLLGFAVSALAQQSPNTAPKEASPIKVDSAQFSPDGKQLITSSTNGTVRIWDARTGKPLAGEASHLGAWQLTSFKYGDAEKWSDAPQDQKRIKLITETHFTWVAYEPATGKLLSMAGGPYTLSDGAYKETIDYAGEGMTDYLHKQQSFTIKVEADKLHQSGQLSDGTKIEEVWQRIK